MFIKSFLKDIKGSTSMFYTLTLGPTIMLAGLTVDYNHLQTTKQKTQNALDASILAAVLRPDLEGEDKQAYALDVFLANSEFDAEKVSYTLASQGENLFGASVDVEVPLFFGNIIGMDDALINAGTETEYSEAEVEVETETPDGGDEVASIPNLLGDACIITMGDKNGHAGLKFNSDAALTSLDCEVHVHKTGKHAVVFNSDVVVDVPRLCVAGSSVKDNRKKADQTTNIELNCTPEDQPFPNGVVAADSSTCDFNSTNYNGGTVTLSPGVYCGSFNFNGSPNVHLEPGLYVISSGKWNVNGGNWTGQGVTLYFDDKNSDIQFNSDTTADLAAPAEGDYAGIVMTDGPYVGTNPQSMILNSSSTFKMTGLINLPNRDLKLNSNSAINEGFFGIVADKITMNSNASIGLNKPADAPSTAGTGETESTTTDGSSTAGTDGSSSGGSSESTTSTETQQVATNTTSQASIEAILTK